MAMQEVAGGMPAHRTRWSGDQRIGRKNRPPGIVVLELNTSLGLAYRKEASDDQVRWVA